MPNYSKSMHRHMIGKIDRAGRLESPEQRAARNPNDSYWYVELQVAYQELTELVGEEEFYKWAVPLPRTDTLKQRLERVLEKIEEVERLNALCDAHDDGVAVFDEHLERE